VTASMPAEAGFMQRALHLAARGQGRVEPNPLVGCVVVRGTKIIGEGYHQRFGAPHAEVQALRRCKGSAKGATVYVTLEPCCFVGKTPPCTDALIQAGVGRVVAAMRDPNPRVTGRGLRVLRAAGVRAEVGLLQREAAELNAPYVKLTQRGRPWVILKWAQSLDGKIATRTGDSKWITDRRMRAHAQRTRGRVDAVIVGVATVLADDPQLTCRVGRPRRVAVRVVVDTRLRTPPQARLVKTAKRIPTWIFCGPRAPRSRATRLERAGCVIQRVQRDGAGLSLDAVLETLGTRAMTNVLVEGGGRVLGCFFDRHLADEVHIYQAPLLMGGRSATGALGGLGVPAVREALRLTEPIQTRRIGDGWFVQARLR
jgi:diaminohydroxyphosphoribosylaminopyrimidine deaminase/5-amino-6-(5-phosphoribosylamino)uracil reductase